MNRFGESARWADLTIGLVVKANSMSARKSNIHSLTRGHVDLLACLTHLAARALC